MQVRSIVNPLAGEQVIGVSPGPALEPRVSDWNRRLNLFTGRALSPQALTAEQDWRAGRLATRGQALSPGIVTGFETGIEPDPRGGFLFHIAPGLGLTATGEELMLPAPVRLRFRDIPVKAPPEALGGAPDGSLLGALIDANAPLPRAGMLVLQPVVTEIRGIFDPEDPCEENAADDAFDDLQLVDGARLLYFAWPVDTLPMPVFGAQWRNRLANAIFSAEAGRPPDDPAGWEIAGLPIALAGFGAEFQPLFLDRFAVARRGGKAQRRTAVAPGAGNPSLWQARIEQLAEHLSAAALASPAIAAIAAEFRHLPPAGLLPKAAMDLVEAPPNPSRLGPNRFFPANYSIDAAPAPLEQLDSILASSASMAPFDFAVPDQVRILVPVPQIWFEPNLLNREDPDPLFNTTLQDFLNVRGIWLARRADVRRKEATLAKAVTGTETVFPDPDPDALEQEEAVAADPVDPNDQRFTAPEEAFGTEPGEGNTLRVTPVETLRASLEAIPGVSTEVPQLDALGLSRFIALLEAKVKFTNDRIDFGFLRVQTNIYRTRQLVLGSDAASRLATSPALSTIAQGESAVSTRADLIDFLDRAKQKPTVPEKDPRTVTPGRTTTQGEVGIPFPVIAGTEFGTGIVLSGGFTGFSGPAGGFERFAGPQAFMAPRPLAAAITAPAAGLEFQQATPTSEAILFQRGAGAAAATPAEVTQQAPVTGAIEEFRTVSVAERLKIPPAFETRSFSLSSKAEVITSFLGDQTVAVGDIQIPGFKQGAAAGGANESRAFNAATITDGVLAEVLDGRHDPVADDADEAAFFSAGVRALDHSISILRLVEGRVQRYQRAIALSKTALTAVQDLSQRANLRLQVIGNGLAEARHDVSVARSLLAEEMTRVGRINDRRNQIVRDQVTLLAYFRPRTADPLATVPFRSVAPGLTEEPVPACLAEDHVSPPELGAMVNLLREAPVAWFTDVPALLDRFDRFDVLVATVQNSRLRANANTLTLAAPSSQLTAGPLAPAITKVFLAQQAVVAEQRFLTAQMDLAPLVAQTWDATRNQARQIVSLGDLIDAGHLRPDASRRAAKALEDISRVAACLYAHFGEVLPAIRLVWAERVSQYDGPIDLRNLANLPRWGELDPLDRQEMQIVVNWLFQRIDSRQPAAVALMNDVVRVALLVASHAPVSRIIAGRVPKATTVKLGGRLPLAVDIAQVHVGMHVVMYAGNQTVARAVVEDLASGQATARVIQAASDNVTLEAGARAQFAEPEVFDGQFGRMLR